MDFWKMNGAGNDFIIINNLNGTLPTDALPSIAKQLCERHLSIGADGMMVVTKARQGGDYAMLFYNSDGSLGEMCGNGARCICRYGFEAGLAGEKQRVETTAGMITGYRIDKRRYRIRLNDPSVVKLDMSVNAAGKEIKCDYVELGSPGLPHAIVEMKGLSQLKSEDLIFLGRSLRYCSAFPKGANVNFYELTDEGKLFIRTFERGVEDFTYACGTGTGSTVLALTLKGVFKAGTDVSAFMRGGELKVRLEMRGERPEHLWLTGPTNIVCKGAVTDEELNDLNIISGGMEK